MPFVEFENTVVPEEKPNLVINPTPMETQVVDTRKEQYDTLSSFISGSKWAVDYYSQVQGRDNAAASFQPDLPKPYGQYRLVRNFELIVTSPLSYQQNSGDVRGWTATGTAAMYSVITPNNGDVFIADVGDGQNALVQITSTQRGSIFPEAATTIEFRITDVLSATMLEELNSRVVETLFFDRENFRNGIKPLINKQEADVIRRLNQAYQRLVPLYFRDFYDRSFGTFIVPGQTVTTYDPYMTRFVRAIIDSQAFPQIYKVNELTVSHDVLSDEPTVLDVILRKDLPLLYSVSKRVGVSRISAYRAFPLMRTIYYSGVEQVVSVTDPHWANEHNYAPPHAFTELVPAGIRQTDVESILPALNGPAANAAMDASTSVHPVCRDDFYIFSREFYQDAPGMSQLEVLLRARLNDRAIDLEALADIADSALRFDNIDRFYYTPIILALIKLAPGVL